MNSVLVLDDRATDRELLGTVLGDAGYTVLQASSGEAALELARADRPDLIIADVLMPGMNGYEFVHELRRDRKVGSTPAVLWAPHGAGEVRRHLAEGCGVSDFLSKPREPEEVIRVVREVLGSSHDVTSLVPVERFHGEQLRVLNDTLVEKGNELEAVSQERDQLQARLRQAENQTAESLTLLETLQSTAPVGFGFVDLELRIIRINETLAAVNGGPVEDQVGRTVAEVVPDLWPQLESVYRHVLNAGEAVVNQEIEGETAEAPGEQGFWLASFYPVRVNGEVIGIGLVVIDITERKRAEDLRSVVMDNMAEGLYVLDAEGRLTLMNAAASKMLGWSEDELRGKPVHAAIHFQHADGSPFMAEECELLKARFESRAVRMTDDAFTRKDGSIFPVAYSAAPLLGGTNANGIVVVFRDTTEEKAQQLHVQRELDALTWVGRIRDALDDGRFVLYSQPIVPLAGGEGSEELLLRMVGRTGEIILPGAFLPVAEKYGLIGEVDQWVVAEAVRLAARGRHVEANLSAESIANLDLLSLIERELREARTDPSKMVFEITETALMENLEAGEAFARGLAEIGCGLALDDFGTGFGTFNYLKNLPISHVKIDVEFVRDLASNPANQHIVKAIVGLARDFKCQTIAEGVEDGESLALMRDYGVDFAQGFHLGPPAPIEIS